MQKTSRFIDNNDGTVTDSETSLTWTREDVWQKESRWVTWDEAKEYTLRLADSKFAGHNDWHLPSIKEALTLYDETQTSKDKYDNLIHLSPVFPEAPQATIWCEEPSTGNEGPMLDFRTGKIGILFKSKCPRMSARAVRGKPAFKL